VQPMSARWKQRIHDGKIHAYGCGHIIAYNPPSTFFARVYVGGSRSVVHAVKRLLVHDRGALYVGRS
jgi:hypothetical protein